MIEHVIVFFGQRIEQTFNFTKKMITDPKINMIEFGITL